MTCEQHQLNETLFKQLEYIYPLDDKQKLLERYKSIKDNNEKIIETYFKNVAKYESYNFPAFRNYNLSFQNKIRKNSLHCAETGAIDFFEILSKLINDQSIHEILSIEVITLLFENPSINKQRLNLAGLELFKKLTKKFMGYSPNQIIQFYLIITSENINDKIFSFISNIEYLLSLEIDSEKLPKNFFNSSLIDDLIINDSQIKKMSFNCFKMMGDIYKILGQKYIKEINGQKFQSKILISQVDDKTIHEKNIEEFRNFLLKLMTEFRKLDLINEYEDIYVNKQVLEFLIENNKFDYSENLNILSLMKKKLPEISFDVKLIWNILKPEIFTLNSNHYKQIVYNVKNLYFIINSEQSKDKLNFINTDLVNGLIEANCFVSMEKLNELIKLNRFLSSKNNLMADLNTIKNFFKCNITETTLDIDELVQQVISKNAESSAKINLDTERVSLNVQLRESNLEEKSTNKILFYNNEVTILIDLNEQKEKKLKKFNRKFYFDFIFNLKFLGFVLIIFSISYLVNYMINL